MFCYLRSSVRSQHVAITLDGVEGSANSGAVLVFHRILDSGSGFCILYSGIHVSFPMRLALLPLVLLLSDCSTDITKGRLVGDTSITQGEAEKTNYPPNKLPEQTFVFSGPIGYESKHSATDEETKIALKAVRKLGSGYDNQRFIAIPVASAKGNSTTAEVMVYDNRKQILIGESVYRLANTPASGQPLKLDDVTAVYASPEE
jgi:hypothetical protein